MISFFAVEELGEEAEELPVLLGPSAVMMSHPTGMRLCVSLIHHPRLRTV